MWRKGWNIYDRTEKNKQVEITGTNALEPVVQINVIKRVFLMTNSFSNPHLITPILQIRV